MSQVCLSTCAFQSTPSVGRATTFRSYNWSSIGISIHALRGEGDFKIGREIGKYIGISIHALRGEGDHIHADRKPRTSEFQSTPSVGRATAKIYKYAMLCLYIVYIKLYIFATAVLFI